MLQLAVTPRLTFGPEHAAVERPGGAASRRAATSARVTDRIIVCPAVDAADVVAGATEAELREVEERLEPGLNRRQTRPERIIDALYSVHIPVIDSVDWATPYVEAGLSARWVETARRLRVRNHPGFCRVRGFDTVNNRHWVGRRPSPSPVYAIPRAPALHLDVLVPTPNQDRRSLPEGTRETPPRWPYPTVEVDVGAVQALATRLAPRVTATFNGAARLSRDPVLVPICAMAASVIAVANRVSARKSTAKRDRRKAWNSKVTWSLFGACLDALDLGEHRGTAERILFRDHPEHIHVAAPPDLQPTPGLSALGAFASAPKAGGPMRVEDAQRRLFLPRVLYCLAAPEPF